MAQIKIEIVGLQPSQTGFAPLDDPLSRQPDVVRPFPHPLEDLRDDQELIAASLERVSEDLFGATG